jgi:hypothetical protein
MILHRQPHWLHHYGAFLQISIKTSKKAVFTVTDGLQTSDGNHAVRIGFLRDNRAATDRVAAIGQ